MAIIYVTIFLSAFLLFQIQPLIAKFFLAWFGGSPAVWVTSMLVFQSLLLLGYAYAHGLTSRLGRRAQSRGHVVLLLAALGTIGLQVLLWQTPLLPEDAMKPGVIEQPAFRLIGLLIVTCALPFFMLSATNSLAQRWFSRIYPERSPYSLYALSNTGSLLGLLTYPFVFEPLMGLRAQAMVWTAGFTVFCVGMAWIAWRFERQCPGQTDPLPGPTSESPSSPPIQWMTRGLWFLLSFTGVALFLGVSNRITLDIGGISVLWVLPLAIYLASYIYTFRGTGHPRQVWLVLAVPAVVGFAIIEFMSIGSLPTYLQVGIPLFVLGVGAVLCHGELYLLRPATDRLTEYYLWLAGGGAAAGFMIAIAAPALFSSVREYHLGLLLCFMLTAIVLGLPHIQRYRTGPKAGMLSRVTAAMCAIGVFGVTMFSWGFDTGVFQQRRSFFGVTTVRHIGDYGLPGDPTNPKIMAMYHGSTIHGITVQDRPDIVTTYFSPSSGVGQILLHHPARRRVQNQDGRPFKIGIMGLGVGTLVSYAGPQDIVRVYEIDPAVIELAGQESDLFKIVSRSPADVSVVLGDARVSLEQELRQQGGHDFDVLILDAFSGDAPPNHLLTLEAIEIYQQHLSPEGVIAVNISNRYFDFLPLLLRQADESGLQLVYFHDRRGRDNPLLLSSQWVLMSPARENLTFAMSVAPTPYHRSQMISSAWTDDYTNPLGILKSWRSSS